VKWLLVQILVVVAAIQTGNNLHTACQNKAVCGWTALKSVVEKVSLRVALKQGLVGPKC